MGEWKMCQWAGCQGVGRSIAGPGHGGSAWRWPDLSSSQLRSVIAIINYTAPWGITIILTKTTRNERESSDHLVLFRWADRDGFIIIFISFKFLNQQIFEFAPDSLGINWTNTEHIHGANRFSFQKTFSKVKKK